MTVTSDFRCLPNTNTAENASRTMLYSAIVRKRGGCISSMYRSGAFWFAYSKTTEYTFAPYGFASVAVDQQPNAVTAMPSESRVCGAIPRDSDTQAKKLSSTNNPARNSPYTNWMCTLAQST